NASSGLVSGTPTTAGAFSYTIKVTDSGGPPQTATRVLSGTINAGALQVTPATHIVATGTLDRPIQPSSFAYTLSTPSGSASFAISGVPSWLTASATSGTATTSGTPVTFTVNASASQLPPGTYPGTISFTNTTNGSGTQTRAATLTLTQCNTRLGDLNGDA